MPTREEIDLSDSEIEYINKQPGTLSDIKNELLRKEAERQYENGRRR